MPACSVKDNINDHYPTQLSLRITTQQEASRRLHFTRVLCVLQKRGCLIAHERHIRSKTRTDAIQIVEPPWYNVVLNSNVCSNVCNTSLKIAMRLWRHSLLICLRQHDVWNDEGSEERLCYMLPAIGNSCMTTH